MASGVDYKQYYAVEKINKRTLGKAITDICGNEGTVDEEENAAVRHQLQVFITYLETENEAVWKNAEIKLFDGFGRNYYIRAGKGQYKFIILNNGDGNIEIFNSNRPRVFTRMMDTLPGLRSTVRQYCQQKISMLSTQPAQTAIANSTETNFENTEDTLCSKIRTGAVTLGGVIAGKARYVATLMPSMNGADDTIYAVKTEDSFEVITKK